MLRNLPILFFFLVLGLISLATIAPALLSPDPMGPYLNGIFPKTTPGAGGSWALEDAYPELSIASPLRILEFPNSEDLLVLSKVGEIWRVSLQDQSESLVLDIKDRAFKLGEAGTIGMALHPQFGNPNAPDQQLIFVFYRSKPEPDKWTDKGFNRLSKFAWDPLTQSFDLSSEEILIQQYDRSTWHNGGGMFFGADGFLYLSLGDEGLPEYQVASTQSLSRGLFSGVLRIDVDNDPGRSHPIRRQPLPNADPPAAWFTTFTQGYSIPKDNPWLSPDSSALEEFYAIGTRSPFSMHYDRQTEKIWVADVGSVTREEVSLIEKGDNLQWPYLEGTFEEGKHQKPEPLIGKEKGIFFEYDRSVGSCIIGGGIYRGERFPSLNEKYLFADFTANKLMALPNTGTDAINENHETLISNLYGQGIDLPSSASITGVHFLSNGEILLTLTGAITIDKFLLPGKILRLKQKVVVPDPPSRLSELNVFTDLENLIPIPGIIPYTVNAPLWSDRATKKRWIAVPNDGKFDSPEEWIDFKSSQEWTFPAGTVFIKHFDLPLETDGTGISQALETRFFVIGEDGIGYGLTYKWNAEGSDAFLLGGGTSSDYDIMEDGSIAYSQTWNFPSRDQCMSCHTANAKYVLGVKTHQLNGDQYYPNLGSTRNQLDYLQELGAFRQQIKKGHNYAKAYPIEEASADLGLRIRSYLDANCSSCHRKDGVPMVDLDLRFEAPLRLKNMVNFSTQSQASDPDRLLVKPGDHAASELWVRDASTTENRMPPIGRQIVDQVYVDSLAKWIDQLTEDAGNYKELLLYPNPSTGTLTIHIGDHLLPPFQIRVYGMDGRIQLQGASETSVLTLDLSKQAAGTYLLEVRTKEDRQMGKFILQ